MVVAAFLLKNGYNQAKVALHENITPVNPQQCLADSGRYAKMHNATIQIHSKLVVLHRWASEIGLRCGSRGKRPRTMCKRRDSELARKTVLWFGMRRAEWFLMRRECAGHTHAPKGKNPVKGIDVDGHLVLEGYGDDDGCLKSTGARRGSSRLDLR